MPKAARRASAKPRDDLAAALVAEGIVGAWRQEGAQDTPRRLAAVAARFAAAGLDLQRPWLGPGGADPFVPPSSVRLP